ncbi:O-methyltransferase [Striga asiatica]|uniref:O-methyltransferase n=1 Tax=Striga asiatica TaxID=4170 RepID=A0A5A7PVF0_STRAF|nr:O-methyltransferase [Striga asiatica]
MDYSAVVNEDDAHLLATHIAACSAFPAAVKCAIELNLFELMKQLAGFVSASELAAKVAPANSEAHLMIDRILRLLASYSVVKCRHTNNERHYSLGPVCEFFTDNQDGASLAPLFLLMHANLYQTSWGKLKDSIVEGGVPFNKAHGMSLYEHSALNPKSNKLFFDAMSDNSTILMKKIVATYNGFEGLNSIVDVGGGIGSTTNMIVSRYPMIKGINFDLLHVIQHAPSYSGKLHMYLLSLVFLIYFITYLERDQQYIYLLR